MIRSKLPHISVLILLTLFAVMPKNTAAQKKPKKAAPVKAAVVAPPPDIAYTVSMSKPSTHYLEVEMRVRWAQMPDALELKMPVWTPGSYLVREYARHVQDFSAANAGGAALGWRKISKNTWQVDPKGVKEVVVSYRVYSNELTVRTNELNDEHAFWNNTATLLFVRGRLDAPATVRVVPFGNWRVATGLPATGLNTYRAENFDVLYDSPFEVSDFKEVSFELRGKKHRIVVSGEGNYDLDKLAVDFSRIVEESAKIFGEIPYEDYTFIVNLRGGGGLEHLNSTALQVNRFNFKPASRYNAFLALVAHEHFHAYNVKRIRPDALGPFDYENENYTRLLWVAEGNTEYYSNLIMRRAGFITDKEFLADRASSIQQLQERPGRFETSLEESSFDAWIKYYRQDENAVNNQISYYDKGEIVTMLLDITIRKATDGKRSLDDVMRYLYAEYYKKGTNYSPAQFQKAAETIAGTSLDDFFTKYVRGTAELDYSGVFQSMGLSVRTTETSTGRGYLSADAADGSSTVRSVPALGADLAEEGGKLTVRMLLAGGPGFEQGLNTGDQILALDGYKAGQAFVQRYIGERQPGDKVKVTFYRHDRLRDLTITLGKKTRTEYQLVPVAEPTQVQKRLYQQYLNAEL